MIYKVTFMRSFSIENLEEKMPSIDKHNVRQRAVYLREDDIEEIYSVQTHDFIDERPESYLNHIPIEEKDLRRRLTLSYIQNHYVIKLKRPMSFHSFSKGKRYEPVKELELVKEIKSV